MTPRRTVLLLCLLALLTLARAMSRGGPATSRRLASGPPSMPASALASPSPRPWQHSSLVLPGQAKGAEQTLLLVDPDAPDDLRQLVTGFAAIAAPAWSPDGRSLAFAAQRDRNWDVYAVGADGNRLQRLTQHAAFDGWPAWSPDGRSLAFVSHREGSLAVHRLDLAAGEVSTQRISEGAGPAIEPAWSPDGRWLAYAAWNAGAYRLELRPSEAAEPARVLATPDGDSGLDLRAPAWSPDGSRLAWLALRHGEGQLLSSAWQGAAGTLEGAARTHAAAATSFAWLPGGQTLAILGEERAGRRLTLRSVDAMVVAATIALPPGPAAGLSWSRLPLAGALPRPARPLARTIAAPASRRQGDPARPGLVHLPDVTVPGAQINAVVAADFAALRAGLRAEVGQDFLGTLSDAWRPLGFQSSGSAFFSWHKTGRAFDTQMELWGPSRRRDMVLLREDLGGRTQWRMFLRAAAQDGSAGRPLTEAGWTFAAGSGDPSMEAGGGRRGGTVPSGYWLDFTEAAARYGWLRIPSIERGHLNWRRNWTGIEYWHYERRDGLRWFEAASEVYSRAELAEALHPDRLRALDLPLSRLVRLGFPAGWPDEG